MRSVSFPNFISMGRLLAVPLVVWLMLSQAYGWAFWIFVLAGVSDAIDGFVAKRFGRETELGKFLDPLADKALLVSVYVTLGQAGHLDVWLVILVVFRDVLIIGGAILSQTIRRPLPSRPLIISKINTAAQIALAAGVLGSLGLSFQADWFIGPMTYAVGATTVASGLAYLITWSRLTGNHGDAG